MIIKTIKDYDGYFTKLVESWIARKTAPFKHETVEITSGPYHPDAVFYSSDGNTLKLDFYSALRVGFGSLSTVDVDAIIDLL